MPQLSENQLEDVIKTMTLEEKANLVVGNGFYLPISIPGSPLNELVSANPKDEQTKVPGAIGTTCAIPRLGITSLTMVDGPSGVNVLDVGQKRVYYATLWPCPELVACSWDTGLATEIGEKYGHETKEYGIDIILAPGINIHRNPLCGRNFEYFSEDPVVTGNMAAAYINGIQSNGVGTTPKHLAANNQEFNRSASNTIASERALREIYLKGWDITINKSNPWAIMTSYNLINGIYTAEHKDLLTNILRDEFGFKGTVMTDWYGGKNVIAMMKSGNSLIMPGTPEQAKTIIDAVNNKELSEAELNQNVKDILNLILKSPSFNSYKYSDNPDLFSHAQIAREAAAESMVLLKNESEALPFKNEIKTISLFGNSGYDLIPYGRGGGQVNSAYKISLDEGLARAGYTVERNIGNAYKNYITQEGSKHQIKPTFEEMMNPTSLLSLFIFDSDLLQKTSEISDIAVISIGRFAGESKDRELKDDYYLSEIEKEQIKNISKAFHAQNKKVVVVLNIAGVIDVSEWQNDVDAILLAWLPGSEGGNAITDILSGKVNPSGKLASTFPLKYEDIPSSKNFPGKLVEGESAIAFAGALSYPTEVIYEEGIYVGYRYFSTFNVKPAYEFGYGLSYTNFQYDDLKLSNSVFSNELTASIKVTNTGKVAGKEIVELYITAPVNDLDKPALELKAFSKTKLLEPGESKTLTFKVNSNDLASYNTKKSSWIVDAGNYKLKIGASSLDIRKIETFEVANDIVVKKVQNAFDSPD